MARVKLNLDRVALAARDSARKAGERVVTPHFVERHTEKATRTGQWLAAILLVVLVPITWIFVRLGHELLVSFLLGPGNVAEHVPFLVTLSTFAFLCVAAWYWVQWVRTAGFGMMNLWGA